MTGKQQVVLPVGPPAPGWADEALCRGLDLNLFFDPEREYSAKCVCSVCPVREPCLAYALAYRLHWGVWGGFTRDERLRLLGRQPKRGGY